MGGYSKIKSIISSESKNKTRNPSSPTDLPSDLPDVHQQKQTTESAEECTKPTAGESDHNKSHDVNESKKSASATTETNPSPSSDDEEDEEQGGGGDQAREHNDVNGGEMKLKRNSSTATYRFMRFDKQGSGNGGASGPSKLAIQDAVRRAFSMRRSSSVSERYSRIYDRSVTVTSPIGDEEDQEGNVTDHEKSGKSCKKGKKSGRSKIIRACKRMFGL